MDETALECARRELKERTGLDQAYMEEFKTFSEVDHDMILREAMKTLREKIHFEPIGFKLLPGVFTMPQFQNLYESILEVHFAHRNFSNKMLYLGILEDTGDRPSTASNRIPVRYRFNKEKYDEMKAKGFRLEFQRNKTGLTL